MVQSQTVRPQEVQPEGNKPEKIQPEEVQPQDAQPHHIQLPGGSETAATSTRNEGATWALAFSMVQKRESELMLAYEEYLSSLQGDHAADANLSAPEFVKAIVNSAIKHREEKRWRVSLLGKDIEVRKQAERLAKLLLWSDPFVKSAVSNQPYAALAWSGVSILLPLVTSSITQNEAMLKGFNSIGDVQMYWQICEETCLSSLDGPSHQQFIEPVAKLYSYIVEYQARVICHLSKKQLNRAWNDITSPGDWETKIKEIDRLNKDCRNILQLLNADQIENKWNKQLSEMQESREILDKIHNALLESGSETRKNYKDEKATELLHLLASDYQGHKNFNPQKVEGTCEWFLADERFRNWRDSDDSRLLWVSAGPGCGKSVLSRALIDERRLSTNVTTSTVCYFFFKDGDKGRMYAHNALCAILHQLFTQDFTGNLIEQALPSYKNFGGALTESFDKLWELFLQCARTSDCGQIICLIDALDECHEESRKMLIDGLKILYQHSSKRPSRLKFLITSRPYDDIESSFRRLSDTATYLRFDGDDKSGEIGNEIDLVIDARINDIAQSFNEDGRRLIADKLKSTKSRTYLWLHLTIDIIMKSPSEYSRPVDVEALLLRLPLKISEAYEKILDKSKRRDYTEALLGILLAAARPLTLDEANCALTLAIKKQPFESFKALENEIWPPRTFKDDVKNLCGLFISVYDGTLSFIHQTAREFLLSRSPGGNWKGRFTLPKSHSRLSSACLRYLVLPDLPGLPPLDSPRDCISVPRQLHSYAAKYWALHYNSLEAEDAALSLMDARKLCREPDVWAPHHPLYYPGWKEPSALCLAVMVGSRRVALHLLLEGADDDMSSIDKALCLASERGHGQIAQMLLDHGANVNADAGSRTALLEASRNGHTKIAQMLLDHGANVNADAGSRTALQAASLEGHTEIIQMLLDHGADVNVYRDREYTALQAASLEGHTEIVQILLRYGANIEADQVREGTALYMASLEGHIEIVQILLRYGANIEADQVREGTALYMASLEGHIEIVQILLNHGANANGSSVEYGTALQKASRQGYTEIVQMLLDYGANVNACQDRGYTALQAASEGGQTDIVRILLRYGANVEAD